MSSSPPPKRRFLPEPVETTTKSSRKFVPEPVETTIKSSRRFAPEPVETTTKSSRKFAPEPVEMTAKSNRKFAVEPVETTTKSSRRFAPEPVETTSRSSKDKAAPAADDAKPPRRFAPQPVETTTRTNRAGAENGANGVGARSADASLSDAQASPQIDAPPQSGTRPRRKFSPQLIETAKRTRKAGDVGPAVNQADRTEATPEAGTRSPGRRERPLPKSVVPANTPNNSLAPVPPHLLEARRMGIPLRSDSISSNRSHSFRVPDLDTIESSESEEEGTPSLSTSPSAESESEQSNAYYDATRRRESVDERFSGYLLEIAAKAAENQMREAAMAAFPNDDHHEPVSHFMAHEDEEDEVADEIMADVNEERRESFTKVNWELLAMQKHMEQKAETEDVRKTEVTEKTKKAADQPTKKNIWGEPQWGAPSNKSPWGEGSTAKSPWGNPFANQRGRPDEREMQGMQRGARPPMLGGDIVFPRCPSPEPARFDVTQGSEALRNSMCYLTEQTQPDEPQGLWRHEKKGEAPKPQPPQPQTIKQNGFAKEGRRKPPSKLWSSPGSRPPSPGGLWNGCCLGAGSREGTKQAGMLTPRIEVDNPFDSPPPTPAKAPPSPPPSNPDMASIDDKLAAQQALEEEFSDAFVTQVYNYLSLGYPSLARKFDDELSKISRIPVEELRQDDELAQARGYIRLGEDNNAKDAGITEDTCMRWRALKVYIYEWAKQQPRMLHAGHALGGFGVGARRGSWAW